MNISKPLIASFLFIVIIGSNSPMSAEDEYFRFLLPEEKKGLTAGETAISNILTPRNLPPESISGKFLYTTDRNVEPNILVLQRLSPQPMTSSSNIDSVVYAADWPEPLGHTRAYSPKWSPNGRQVLFSVGYPESTVTTHSLYVLDTETHEVRELIKSRWLANPFCSWSADGNWIACIMGGDTQGLPYGPVDYSGPMDLRIINWRSGEVRHVATSDNFGDDFVCSWSQDTLWYSVEDVSAKGSQHPIPTGRPNIYAHSLKTHKSRLVIRDAYRPTISPDAGWLCFYGSSDTNKPVKLDYYWQYLAANASLCIARSDGTRRRALEREPGRYADICWLGDSRNFVTVQRLGESPLHTVRIKQWDSQRGTSVNVAELHSKDYKFRESPAWPNYVQRRFNVLGVSDDNRYLFLKRSRLTGEDSERRADTYEHFLLALNLNSGRTAILFSGNNAVDDFDFIQKSAVR